MDLICYIYDSPALRNIIATLGASGRAWRLPPSRRLRLNNKRGLLADITPLWRHAGTRM